MEKHLYKALLFSILIAISSLFACKETPKAVANPDHAYNDTKIARATERPEIIPVSHGTLVMVWGDITIYVDPVGGAKAFGSYPEADLILITDIHGDHFSLETLESLNTRSSKIIVPQAVADLIPDKFTPQVDVLDNGESKERHGINVTAIPMYNLREVALDFHKKGRGNGYVLERSDYRVYISGDTEDIPEMRGLKDIDDALVCMNLPYTMTVESAADAVSEFKPKRVYPYHYRGRPDVSDVQLFKKLVNQNNPDIEVVLLDWYPDAPY